jgi:hypothetical protein
MLHLRLLAASALLAPAALAIDTVWSCATLASAPVAGAPAGSATWSRLRCSSPSVPLGTGTSAALGPLIVNVVAATLSASLRLVPALAPAMSAHNLAPLDAIAALDGRKLVAGINGGYFFRLDEANFFDGVCIGKTAAVAEEPVAAATPNTGIADGGIVSRGALVGSNCDCLGFNLPVWLTMNGSASDIAVTGRASAPPAGLALDALAAGPNLVSTNASGTFVDVRSGDENFANVFEWSANTGMGFAPNGSTAFLATFDGYDGCPQANTSCGTNAFTMAAFFKDFLKVSKAMAMDQGGSTTMFVKGQGVVSNPGAGVRAVFSGLFLEAVA